MHGVVSPDKVRLTERECGSNLLAMVQNICPVDASAPEINSQPSAIWLEPPFPAIELDGKSVQFRILLKEGGRVRGNGVFRALTNNKGLVRIEIVVTERRSANEFVDTIYYCPADAAACIRRLPPGSKFDFSLFEFPGE